MATSRSLFRPGMLVRYALTIAAIIGAYYAIDAWVAGRTTVSVDVGGRPVEFLDPRWFLLASIVPIFFLVRIWSLTDLSVFQQIVQSTVRSLVVAGIAVALARPSWVTRDSKVATVALIDVSDSVSDAQLEAARTYLSQLAKAKGEGSLQVITFAEKPRVERADGAAYPLARHRALGAATDATGKAAKAATTGGAGTDIQSAMQLGYGLYPDGYLPRMVVISDGNQTTGDIAVESYRAKELGVKVSWRQFAENKVAELRVVGISLPEDLKVGAPYEVTAEIWTTEPQTVTLALQQDEFPNPLEPSKTVTLREGKNLIKFKSDAKRAGATTYRLRVTRSEKDTEKANNESIMTAPVKGRPNILYVEGGVLREPGSAGYLQRALQHENMDVEVRGPKGIPGNAKDLEKFDCVVVSDVPYHLMSDTGITALDKYVSTYGGGLIVAGGEDSFGSGGYQGTKMEQIMPVRFDAEKMRDQPDIAMVLVIDHSGSMQGPKLEAAKESARVTVEVLSPDDIIAVVVFDDQATTFIRPQRAANRMRISAELSTLQSGGGTDIKPGLAEAYSILQGVNAKVKHVILLSDGEAPREGIQELVSDMRSARITVSAVGVDGADRSLLQMITEAGDGRLYMIDDLGSLPRIFAKETTEAQKSQLVEDLVYARVAKRVEAIEGTAVENAPALHGYVTTKPKPTGEVILISDLGEPILARWRHGAGTAVAWTSDVKNRWSVDWIRWGGYPKFWAQVIRSTMRKKVYDSYDLTARVDDGIAKVTVDAIDPSDKFVNELDTQLEVVDPKTNATIQTIAMDQSAAGRYDANFRIERYGSFLLKAVHKRDGKVVAESMGSVAMSYPLEYLRSTPDPEPLMHAATVTGGKNQAEPAAVWSAEGESISYVQDLWAWVLLGVAGLFVLDIYLRRLRLFGYRTIKFD